MRVSVAKVASLIADGDLSPTTLVDNLLRRIECFDAEVQSCLAINPRARVQAGLLAREAKLGRIRGPLHGIPVSVKDLIDTAGLRTTYGSPLFSNSVPRRDARVVSRLKEAGALILCKTNTHEFALGIETPPTKNPWETTRIPGGSSGGSAAALAADLALFAIGTDTGGSIRIPASMCGVTGLKPTYGAVSAEGVFPEAWSLDHVGPMCRFASDLPLLLECMGYPKRIKRVSRGFRVGLEKNFFERASKHVVSTVEAFVDKGVSEGFVEPVEVSLPLIDRINSAHGVVDTAEIATVHRQLYPRNRDKYLPASAEQIEMGQRVMAVDYAEAQRFRPKALAEVLRALRGVDLVVSPALPEEAPSIDRVKKMTLRDHYPYTMFLEPFNFVGLPALSLPCGFHGGLPVGVQLVSRPWKEDVLIGLAQRYQEVTDWHIRVPPRFGELRV